MSESEIGRLSPLPPERSCWGPLFIGCGTAVLIAITCVGILTYVGDQFWNFLSDQTHRLEEEAEFARQWEAPPTTAGQATFTPETVDGYTLIEADDHAQFPALGIEMPGHHAIYERGDRRLQVAVYAVDDALKEVIFDEVERRIEDESRFPGYQMTRMPNILDFQLATVELAGRLWYSQGWLIFVRGQPNIEIADFTKAYVNAVAEAAGEAPPEADPAEPEATPVESSSVESSPAESPAVESPEVESPAAPVEASREEATNP